jgi:hypothetical protein
MSERMENAMELASKCWKKANDAEPEFVEEYLRLAEEYLATKPAVQGDEFREHCAVNGLRRPASLHPNVWVSGVKALRSIGWITPIKKVEPSKSHNHMPSVTLWRSEIYYQEARGQQ